MREELEDVHAAACGSQAIASVAALVAGVTAAKNRNFLTSCRVAELDLRSTVSLLAMQHS
jgi:hypothetical protein